MNDATLNFERHLDEIRVILLRNNVSNRRSMQLLGLYINLWEARVRLRWDSAQSDRTQLLKITGGILDAITHILGDIGVTLPESEFQNLMLHTSAIHQWGSE